MDIIWKSRLYPYFLIYGSRKECGSLRIKIKVCSGIHKKVNGKFDDIVEMDDYKVVQELFEIIGICNYYEVIAVSNDKVLQLDSVLKDGDEINIYSVLIGG